MRILGIETSCDETAICVIEVDDAEKSVEILGNVVHSQIDIHAPYGGVFPALAKREHGKNLVPVLEKALKEAGLLKPREHSDISQNVGMILEREPELLEAFKGSIPKMRRPDIDFISVAVGPGLEPALWVGIGFARALALVWDIPLVPSNHMEGHILAALISKVQDARYKMLSPEFPALSLLVSGGHTQIVLADGIGSYKIAGETLDDAVGECFDKVARTLGLPYPGGPKISKLAAEARARGIESPEPLPRPMIASPNLDFSFSGLKTAVLYLVKRLEEKRALDESAKMGIAREVEDSIAEVVVSKVRKAIESYGIQALVVGGGVIANSFLRQNLEKLARDTSTALLLPQIDHSTDNGLMIALAGYHNRSKAVSSDFPLKASGTLPIGPRA